MRGYKYVEWEQEREALLGRWERIGEIREKIGKKIGENIGEEMGEKMGEKMGGKTGEEGCKAERETARVSLPVGVVANIQWSQIRDPWLWGGETPFGPLVKS
jgi:hypothetical protein